MRKSAIRVLLPMIAVLIAGCGKQPADSSKSATRVYVDVETKSPVVAPRTSDLPAVNPKTGRRTLMPGLFCARCRRWHPAPPLEEMQRNPAARKCPKCGRALSSDGPAPKAK